MAIARKIAYNVIFNVAAKILSTILALVGIGFITRYLGKDGFGDYSTVLAFFSFFGSIADLGIYSITTREISRPEADEEKILGNALSMRILASILVFFLSPLIIYFLPYAYEVKMGIVIAVASFVFSSTYMVLNGVFQKNLAMDRVATVETLGKIIQTGIIIFAVKMNLGFTTIILSMLFAMIFNFTCVFLLVRRFISLSLRFDVAYWKKFLRESAPLGISSVVIFIYFKIDTILLSILKTSTDVGIYNAAYKVVENITFFPSMIIGLVFPMLSKNIFSNKAEFERISNETFKVFLILAVPLIIGTLFLSDGIIHLIGGKNFEPSINTLRILVFAIAFIFFGGLFNNIMIAGNRQKNMLLVFIFCAIFNVTANIIFIPLYSYKAAAIISTATEFLVMACGFYFSKKYLGYTPKSNHFWKIVLSGLLMGVFLFIFRQMNFFALAISSAVIYAFSLWITKTVSIKEFRNIFSKKPILYE